jgi:hypothetical protein
VRVGSWWRGHTGDLDADLPEDAELVHLRPDLCDLAILKAIEDDGLLGELLAGWGHSGDGCGVRGDQIQRAAALSPLETMSSTVKWGSGNKVRT